MHSIYRLPDAKANELVTCSEGVALEGGGGGDFPNLADSGSSECPTLALTVHTLFLYILTSFLFFIPVLLDCVSSVPVPLYTSSVVSTLSIYSSSSSSRYKDLKTFCERTCWRVSTQQPCWSAQHFCHEEKTPNSHSASLL